MFGFGKKRATPGIRQGAEKVAHEALHGIAGLVEGSKLVFRDFEIELADESEQAKLLSAIQHQKRQLSSNPDHWRDDLLTFREALRKSPAASPHDIAAFTIIAAIIKMNSICKAAIEHPDDSELREMTLRTLVLNSQALDQMFSALDEDSDAELGLTKANHLLQEFQFIARFLDMVSGADRL